MSKRDQILLLDPPNELRFKGPFTDVVTSVLKLSNPSEKRVCFKVKTTAPKRYCVRPNNGLVEPKSHVSVSVMLQPFDYDPNEKNKHKFMVQTMFAPDGDINQETLWKDAQPESLMDSKLKCVFELASDGQSQNNFDSTNSYNEEKIHTAKGADITKFSPKSTNVEAEIKRLLDDNKQWEKENASLRQENIKLKEEGLRLRRDQANRTHSDPSLAGSSSTLQAFAMDSSANQTPNMLHIVIAVVALIFGLIVGKIF